MRYVFGDYMLDTQRYELHRAGVPIRVWPKVFDVLAYLIVHRDRLVSKQELLEHFWPQQVVGEAALNSCIKAVRRAAGDIGQEQRLIHTLHGRGYRFVAAIEERGHEPPDGEKPRSLFPPTGAGAKERSRHAQADHAQRGRGPCVPCSRSGAQAGDRALLWAGRACGPPGGARS